MKANGESLAGTSSYNITSMIEQPPKKTYHPAWTLLMIFVVVMLPTFGLGLLVGWVFL